MDTVIFVIIDQLGWADREHFRGLTGLLGEPRKVTTPYLPTVTETAHASVSVAASPRRHGIIGGESLVEAGHGALRLAQVDESVFQSGGYGDGEPLCSNFAVGDADCFVVAGKRKVAQLLCPEALRPHTLTRVTFNRSSGSGFAWSIQTSRRDTPRLPDCHISELRDADTDSLLIQAAATLLDAAAESGKIRLLLLCLPRLDIIGHWNDRDSQAIVETLERLDRELFEFLSSQFEGQPSHAYRVRETVGRTSPGSQSVIFCQDPTETTEVSSFVVGQLNAGISPGRQVFVALPDRIIASLAFRGDESPSAPFDRGGARVFGRGGHRIR